MVPGTAIAGRYFSRLKGWASWDGPQILPDSSPGRPAAPRQQVTPSIDSRGPKRQRGIQFVLIHSSSSSLRVQLYFLTLAHLTNSDLRNSTGCEGGRLAQTSSPLPAVGQCWMSLTNPCSLLLSSLPLQSNLTLRLSSAVLKDLGSFLSAILHVLALVFKLVNLITVRSELFWACSPHWVPYVLF